MKTTAVTTRDRGDRRPRLQFSGEGLLWLTALLLLAALGWYKSVNLLLLLAYMMLAWLVLNAVVARSQVRRVRLEQPDRPPAFAGEEASESVRVENISRFAASLVIEHALGGKPVRWFIPHLSAGSVVTCEFHRIHPRRGRFIGTLVVRSGHPLGLIEAVTTVSADQLRVVLPARGRLNPEQFLRWLSRSSTAEGQARRILRRPTQERADVRGVRPYRQGDPIREVHWRSTARRRELLVREYDTAPVPDLVLVVEPWLPPGADEPQRQALEQALSLAVTIADTWRTSFARAVVVALAGHPHPASAAGPSDAALRHALAPLAGVSGGTDFPPLTPDDFGRPLGGTARLVVSSRPGGAYAGLLASHTGRPFLALCPHDPMPWYSPPAPQAAASTSPPRAGDTSLEC